MADTVIRRHPNCALHCCSLCELRSSTYGTPVYLFASLSPQNNFSDPYVEQWRSKTTALGSDRSFAANYFKRLFASIQAKKSHFADETPVRFLLLPSPRLLPAPAFAPQPLPVSGQ
jgi:hypothetical protein